MTGSCRRKDVVASEGDSSQQLGVRSQKKEDYRRRSTERIQKSFSRLAIVSRIFSACSREFSMNKRCVFIPPQITPARYTLRTFDSCVSSSYCGLSTSSLDS